MKKFGIIYYIPDGRKTHFSIRFYSINERDRFLNEFIEKKFINSVEIVYKQNISDQIFALVHGKSLIRRKKYCNTRWHFKSDQVYLDSMFKTMYIEKVRFIMVNELKPKTFFKEFKVWLDKVNYHCYIVNDKVSFGNRIIEYTRYKTWKSIQNLV